MPQSNKTHIHFICRGNVYRSRLAEACAKSQSPAKFKWSSSGIEAELALNGPVDPETVRLLDNEELLAFLSPNWKQTTQADIDKANVVIFMSKTLFEQARKQFNLKNKEIKVWDIPDKDGIYPAIKLQVDTLLKDIHTIQPRI